MGYKPRNSNRNAIPVHQGSSELPSWLSSFGSWMGNLGSQPQSEVQRLNTVNSVIPGTVSPEQIVAASQQDAKVVSTAAPTIAADVITPAQIVAYNASRGPDGISNKNGKALAALANKEEASRQRTGVAWNNPDGFAIHNGKQVANTVLGDGDYLKSLNINNASDYRRRIEAGAFKANNPQALEMFGANGSKFPRPGQAPTAVNAGAVSTPANTQAIMPKSDMSIFNGIQQPVIQPQVVPSDIVPYEYNGNVG